MQNKYSKIYVQGKVVSCNRPLFYSIDVDGEQYEIPYSRIHSANIAYPADMISGDGTTLAIGTTVHLVGIVREGEPISWRPAHEMYLKVEDLRADKLEVEARKVYLELLGKAADKGQIPQRLFQSVSAFAQGSAVAAVITLKIYLGLPINIK